jgi:Fe-S-cluster containining protein
VSLCSLCARSGKTCCQQTDVLLTLGDLLRIRAHIGRDDFWECRPPRGPGCTGEEGDPHWLGYTLRADGTRRVLRHTGAEDCLLLSANGCILPGDVRPLICRLHPLNYTEGGIEGTSPECPTHLLADGCDPLGAVGVDLESARRWHAELYRELLEETRQPSRAA